MQLHGYGTTKAQPSVATGIQWNIHSSIVLQSHNVNLSVYIL